MQLANQDYQLLAKFANALRGTGAVGKADGTPVGTYMYTEGGLFGTAKQDPVLVNALVNPMGVMKALDWIAADTENPIYQAITEINSTGYAQEGDCADCGKPEIKRCAQTACFGRVCQMTEEFAIDRLGLRANANVPRLALFGNITDSMGNVLIPMGSEITDLFTLHAAAAAYNLRQLICGYMWTGNPANNAGGHEEFAGFDLLINTGKVDAITHIACDALDSYLINYGSQVVGAAGSTSIVGAVSGLMRQIRYRIMSAGLSVDTARIVIVMHPNVWDCVADAWACEYGLTCQTGAANRNDQMAVTALRDDFINRMVLRIDGKEYPVLLDNCIDQTITYPGNDTAMCSDIAIITTHVNGRRVTWGEFQDLNRTTASSMNFFNSNFGGQPARPTDGGRFLVSFTVSGGYCFDVRLLTKPRIIARMPQLLGKVQNVCCVPTGGPFPDPSGSGDLYEVSGGATTWPPNYLYGDCHPNAGSGPIEGPR